MHKANALIGKTLKKMGANSLLMRLLLESIPQHRKRYAFAILSMVLVALTTGASAWIMGEIVDAMTDSENRARVFYVAGGVVLTFFLKGIASYAQATLMARAGNRIVAEKQTTLYNRLLEQGLTFFNATESSDVLLRVTQSAQMARNVIDTIVTGFVRDLLTLIALVSVMVYQQPLLSIICLFVGPAALFGVQKILRNVRSVMAQEMAGLTEIIKVVQETAVGARVVKSFALERMMSERMDLVVRQVESRANKMVRLQAATAPLMDTITGLAIAGIVILSAVDIFGNPAGTAGQLMSFVTAFLMAYEPAKRLSKMRISIEAGMIGVRMMYELIDQPITMTESSNSVTLPEGPVSLKLDNIRFGYDPSNPVVDGITFEFPQGQTTALVGPSGGGKSTLLNLILRLYDPQEGRILLGGHDLREISFASLRKSIAYVGQDTFLFSNTVMENLRIARPMASDDEVREAARIAHADEFVMRLPLGYNTPIGENGTFLSGGQRQRLAIARAVLRRAPVLLLDEATSALDSHSEVLVRDALERITKGVTTIVVAHRLSTVLRAERICYVEEGKLVETGTLSGLLANGGKFRQLYDQQFSKGL
ncbi:ABC transporter ATP-binding protein [Phaeovulum sp.]|uniref:ABC transporter ATP-binding protein n=1 Tax=Phaeovulum sp. TaxID=2934796 RepID=UPI0039E5C3D9